MNKFFVIVGYTGSGKTTVINKLSRENGYKVVYSHTTRKPKYEGEGKHIFVSSEEFDSLGEMAFCTEYKGNRYGIPAADIEKYDMCVLDPNGATELKKNYKGKKEIVTVGFFCSEGVLKSRLIESGIPREQMFDALSHDRDTYRNLASVADYIIDTGIKTVDETAAELLKIINA